MFESKYSKLLTIILVIVIVAIIGLIGYLAYDYYQNYSISTDASDFVDNFQGEVAERNKDDENNEEEFGEDPLNGIEGVESTGGSSNVRRTYKGFGMIGTMEIPAINFKYPVLERVTKGSIEAAVAFLYGTGLNEPGNTVIVGHNYRNGLFFSNNKKLVNGNEIYVTDNSGRKLTYKIYNKFEATPEDTSFYQRDTGGVAELTLSTCTDNSKARLIIFARAQ